MPDDFGLGHMKNYVAINNKKWLDHSRIWSWVIYLPTHCHMLYDITYKISFAYISKFGCGCGMNFRKNAISLNWQISQEVQKTKWSICKRIGFSPLHSIVQPVILFLSEWTGKGVSTSSTSDALIIISKGVLGRVFCSWWKFFQIIFGVGVNESIAELELFFLTRRKRCAHLP